MRRPARLLAALCAVSLVAAACSDDDDDDTSSAATAEASSVTTEAVSTTSPATTEPATTTPETTAAETTAPETTTPETSAPETTEPSIGSIVDVATEAGTFTTLLAAAEAAGLVEELSTREITLLAPTDDAFAALGQPAIDALLADPVALEAVLRNHMLPVPQTSDQMRLFNNVLTVSGGSLPVVDDAGTLTVGGARVITPDVLADNGVIQVIDAVLVPPPAG
jgi:uncharacterized surface protein with fasciclin (FAS1) repeats